ncbi:MAG: P-loop NTPase fold protein [Chloroflexota bacterium]
MSDYRAAQDGLNFGIFKPALLDILQTADTPLTVGVFGSWGSGKNTLLNMLKDELDAKKLASLRTVWFTAWKYEQHDALWRAFMLRVRFSCACPPQISVCVLSRPDIR